MEAASAVLVADHYQNGSAVMREEAADQALRDVAQILVNSCRRSDIVSRLGQAQFALLAVDAVAPSAPVMLQRLAKRIAVHNETRSPWGPIDLRLSVGAWTAKDGRSLGTFLDTVEAELRQVVAQEEVQALVLQNAVRG